MIATDPTITTNADRYRQELATATAAAQDAQEKLAASADKLAKLKQGLAQGDATITVPALQSSAVAVERCQILAEGAQRRLDGLRRSPKLPPVGVAQVLAEALGKLYPIPVTITTNRKLEPAELPHLVIVIPTRPATPRGGSVVTLGEVELVLHRRSVLERHHDAAKIQAALEAIGWQVRVDEPNEGESGQASFVRVQVIAGFEAAPELRSDAAPHALEVRGAFARLSQTFANFDLVSPDVVELDASQDGDVVTRRMGLRLSSWNLGRGRKDGLQALTGLGSRADHAALADLAGQLQGLTDWGRIASVEVAEGVPAWANSLPVLKGRLLGGAVDAVAGVRGINPTAAAFAVLEVTSRAPMDAEGE